MIALRAQPADNQAQPLFWRLYWKASFLTLNTLAVCAGSTITFFTMAAIVLGWAISGAWLSGQEIWQISMQDVSSVGCYLWDITLLYAQQQDNRELARHISLLQASGEKKVRLLRRLAKSQCVQLPQAYTALMLDAPLNAPAVDYTVLPRKSWYDRWADGVSEVTGSPYIQAIYWGGIIAWLALGPHMAFGDEWQLNVNTATAVELMIMTTFLQNTKRRHRLYMQRCSAMLATIDQELEQRLLTVVDDDEGAPLDYSPQAEPVKGESSTLALDWWRRNFGVHIIVDRYANFIGSISGILLSLVLLAVWLMVGNVMGYDNANWWLIIGSYTGLAGFIDAFVLRNCMKRQNTAILQQCSDLDAKDAELAAILNVLHISSPAFGISGAFGRISHRVGQLAAHVMTVLLAGALVVALLITASVMRWTTTAQLLCNTPTMIIEGGMLLVLMMAHMASHQYMRARLQTLLHRRVAFQSAFDHKQINLESLPMPKAAKEADM